MAAVRRSVGDVTWLRVLFGLAVFVCGILIMAKKNPGDDAMMWAGVGMMVAGVGIILP